jgi:hypothetical protein
MLREADGDLLEVPAEDEAGSVWTFLDEARDAPRGGPASR